MDTVVLPLDSQLKTIPSLWHTQLRPSVETVLGCKELPSQRWRAAHGHGGQVEGYKGTISSPGSSQTYVKGPS